MNVHWISSAGIEPRQAHELKSLLAHREGFAWIDLPVCDEQATRALAEVFGFHPRAVQACHERTHIPKVHAYADHLFLILHDPEPGAAGHIHLLELNQFVGRRYLITVHGPLGESAPLDAALRETRTVLQRIEAGRYRPNFPAELSYYQTRTVTKLNIAMERLALISALMLPVTAIASIYGMNIIVNEHTQPGHIVGVLAVIGGMMMVMFIWAKRQGWW